MKTEHIAELQRKLSKLISEYEVEELREREKDDYHRANYLSRIIKVLNEAWVIH